jgi:uncharacterized protein YbjQ (UPF0145 family)
LARVIITTTHSVEGYRIVEYMTPVVTNIVVGTDLLTDFAASFTDLLGGKSRTYEAHLKAMYAQAMQALREQAGELGANCLVAASFDLDQLSGKGVQMFMLNAVATPVVIKTEAQLAQEAEAEQQRKQEAAASETARRERLAQDGTIAALLADEFIYRQARQMRQLYGRAAYVSFLRSRASELDVKVDLLDDEFPEPF